MRNVGSNSDSMQILRLFVLSLFFFPFLTGKEKPPPKTIYIYSKDIEGIVSKTTWTIEEKKSTLHIQGSSVDGETLLITTPPLNTQSYSYRGKIKQSEYYMYREGPYLYARRTDANGVKQKEFQIGERFWLQEFDFSMRSFIMSAADRLKFYIVDPKKLNLHQMIATKSASLDHIQIGDHIYQATKVKITLTGFKKMFWKAELWFDSQTGDLLKYMANEGPNTPMRIITLVSKTIEK